MTAARRVAALAAAVVFAVAGLTACTPRHTHGSGSAPVTDGPVTPVGDRMALAYMKTHPVPRRPHMTAGISISDTIYGNLDWTAGATRFLTVTGQTITVTCGNPATRRDCPLVRGEIDLPMPGNLFVPNGTYAYIRPNGAGDSATDYRLIKAAAIRLPQVCSFLYHQVTGSNLGAWCASPHLPTGGA